MSDFQEVLVTENPHYDKGRWRSSQLGDWVFVIDGYVGSNGEVYPSKSKNGNPFMIKIHKDNLPAFIEHLQGTDKKVNAQRDEDVAF